MLQAGVALRPVEGDGADVRDGGRHLRRVQLTRVLEHLDADRGRHVYHAGGATRIQEGRSGSGGASRHRSPKYEHFVVSNDSNHSGVNSVDKKTTLVFKVIIFFLFDHVCTV